MLGDISTPESVERERRSVTTHLGRQFLDFVTLYELVGKTDADRRQG